MPLRRLASVLALAAALIAIAGFPAQRSVAQPTTSSLPATIRSLIADAGLGDRVGVAVVDATDGGEIFSDHGDLPLNPASNMKLVTAAGALLRLGPGFRMRTGLYGRIEDGVVGELTLRGFADPTLRLSDLVELGRGLANRGVRRVDALIVDGTYFDEQMLPPAFEQQPNEVAAFRAAISAVAVERSAYELRVIPAREVGGAATVRLPAPGYFEVENAITTSDGQRPNVVLIQRPSGERLSLLLRGSVPAGILGVSYRRRVENPLAHAGHAMVEALGRAGIRTSATVRTGSTPAGSALITSRESPPLAELLPALGKYSDNFTAEMLLKVLGAEQATPGTSARGARVLLEVLEEAGVPSGEASIVNGSGLFDGNQIAASHLTRLLTHMYRNPGLRSEYLSHLAVGGADGTLRRRLRDLPAPRIVRAKTGTLNDVIALSGYVLGPEPGRAVAFSFVANGIRGRQGAARALADAIVRAIADDLY